MNQILDMIKQNKKVAIIIGVVAVSLIVLLLFGNKGGTTSGYFDTVSILNNEEQFNGTAELNVGGKDIHMDILKNGKNFVVSMNVPNSDISYNDLIVKQDGTLYLNSSSVSSNGGLIAIRDAQQTEETISLIPTLISSLAQAPITSTVDADGTANISVSSTEEWSALFSALNTALSENAEVISSGYKEKDAVKTLLADTAKFAKKASETNTVANTISASIKTETVENIRSYNGNFEFTADFSALPDFINPEDFDSNQLKITGNFKITVGEASTAKPVGAVYDANPKNAPQFFTSLWNSIFSKEEYTALNEVTVTSTTVFNKYDLGEVIEESRFVFNKEGVESAEWIISSTNENVINAYVNKYAPMEKPLFDKATGVYNLIFYTSEEGLLSLNKLGTTPEAFGEYLKTAKGGEIIV